MPSDTIPQSPQTPNVPPTSSGPTAQGILAALKDADSPLAFIQANLKSKEAVPAAQIPEVAARRLLHF